MADTPKVSLHGLEVELERVKIQLESIKSSQEREEQEKIGSHIKELDRFKQQQFARCGENDPPGCPPWTMQYPMPPTK